MLALNSGLSMTFSRDKADTSSATHKRLRPDLTAYIGNALVMKGEEKEDIGGLDAAQKKKKKKKSDAARAWIKEAGRMNHLKHSVP